MNLNKNIRDMWDRMLSETRKKAVTAVCDYYGINKDYFQQRWLYGENMPLEKQPKVVEIFQNALKEQHDKDREVAGI